MLLMIFPDLFIGVRLSSMCSYKTLLLIVKVYFAGMDKRKKRFVHNYLALSFLGKEPEPQSSSISKTSQVDIVQWL